MGKKAFGTKKVEAHFTRDSAKIERRRYLMMKATEFSVIFEQEVHMVFFDKKSNDMIEFSTSQDFDESAIAEGKKSGLNVRKIFSCDDIKEPKTPKISKDVRPEIPED